MRTRYTTKFTKPSRTQQSAKQECDINTILDRYSKTGILPTHINRGSPKYGDFSTMQNFRESLHLVQDAYDQFMALPAGLRKKFGHDPASLIEFLSDPANTEEAQKMGLVKLSGTNQPTKAQNDDLNDEKAKQAGSPQPQA